MRRPTPVFSFPSYSLPGIRPSGLRSLAIALICAASAMLSGAYAASVNLAWDPSSSTDVSGYRVYYGTSSSNLNYNVTLSKVTATTISTLSDGIGYYFAVTAFNAAGTESPRSNVISFTSGVNNPPTISLGPDLTTALGQTAGPISFTASDPETALSGLSFSATSSNSTLLPTQNISFGISGSSPTITLTPVAGQSGAVTVTATVSDGILTASDSLVLTVSSSSVISNTIWPATATPTLIDGGIDNSVELGVKFRSDTAGVISGIRFYKANTNTGTHIGTLWTGTGTKLASATFSNETGSGWQQVKFASPVSISANTVYVASYHANSGHYSADSQFFSSTGVDTPPLHALMNGVSGGNGVYAYGTSPVFPSQTWNAANYWVDVIYATANAPLSIGTTTLPAAIVGIPYSTTLNAAGGTSPYTWSITSGALPAGLTLNATTGLISGTTSAIGSYSLNLQVTDSSSTRQSATRSLTLGVTAAQTTVSIWPNTAQPGLVDGGADNSVELGLKFRSDTAGYITGIRFYKAGTNTGTHVGSLWNSTGTRLASATFSSETASGWQQVKFASPVAISANVTYVVSYHASTGHYSADANFFAANGADNAPLHALQNGVSGGNGVYAYGTSSVFPNQTWNTANYWVDVIFQAGL